MNTKKKEDTMSEFLHKQPYNLTIARHTLGIHQMRIMARAVESLQPSMSMAVDYTIRVPDLYLKLDIKDLVVGNNVKPLRLALDSLMKKIVRIMHYIPEEATYLEIGTPIIQEYEYKHGASSVVIKICGKLVPQLIDLARGYTKYSLDVAFKTSSPNVFKLYQYISHFRDKKQIQCNVDTLRQWLQIEDKYQEPAHIKQRILTPAMNELKEKADVWFDIAERITEGRRMKGWKFNIYTKKGLKNTAKKAAIIGAESDLKTLTNIYKLGQGQAKILLEKVSDFPALRAILHQNVYLPFCDKKIHNIGAYTVKFIKEKYGVTL